MKKIVTTLDTVKTDIRTFYQPELHHFMVMNAVDLGGQLEVQWFFCDYALPCDITVFYVIIPADSTIPTVRDIVASAWVAESELADLMNIRIEQVQQGFVLEPDSESGPLRKKK
ncbi:MAG: NADH-quinone oxidoreductase subunit C [Chitinophagales bacterium]|nr:NADH-quinone oxidoreductase subunit C [Chitinophagales bacterium]